MVDQGKNWKVPTFDDFPVDADAEEKSKYIRKKTTEMWQYKKLTSKDSSEYRKQETEQVKAYQKQKKMERESNDDSQSQSQSDSDCAKKLSRER